MTEEKDSFVSDQDEIAQNEATNPVENPAPADSPAGSEEQNLNITDVDMAGDSEVPDPIEQIEALEKNLKETHDRLLRTAAELDNVRKRARRDVEDARQQGRAEVLKEILPAIDSLDLALKSVDKHGKPAGIVEGVQMVRKQFLNATDRFGLKPIDALTKPFDPNFHEAIAQINSDEVGSGCVVEEMRKGYMLGERLLRASMVIVSKGPREAPEPQAEAGEIEIPLTENIDINKEENTDSTNPEEENPRKEGNQGDDRREGIIDTVEAAEEQQTRREEENE